MDGIQLSSADTATYLRTGHSDDASPPSHISSAASSTARILMLVPHDPLDDPRIGWVTNLCRQICRTDIVSLAWVPKGSSVEYDGVISCTRHPTFQYMSQHPLSWGKLGQRLGDWNVVRRYVAARSNPSPAPARRWFRRLLRAATLHVGGMVRTVSVLMLLNELCEAMWRRVRVVAIPPRLVICHDFWSLPAAVRLKRLHGCKILYDAHEYNPHADLLGHPLEEAFWELWERRLLREVDAVVTVGPQLADVFRARLKARNVHSVPNAEPLNRLVVPSRDGPHDLPIKFLLQGNASPGRGFEFLLNTWRQLADPRAVLYVRCPSNAYVTSLMQAYGDLVDQRLVVFLPAVDAENLIEAACFADVGVIPYPSRPNGGGENLNHACCCPNKLSQYMQAGLAILGTNTRFVSECLTKYECGLVYDSEDVNSLVAAIKTLINEPRLLASLKRGASFWAREEFHWETQSLPYSSLIAQLLQDS